MNSNILCLSCSFSFNGQCQHTHMVHMKFLSNGNKKTKFVADEQEGEQNMSSNDSSGNGSIPDLERSNLYHYKERKKGVRR